jgi:hypothetical protein
MTLIGHIASIRGNAALQSLSEQSGHRTERSPAGAEGRGLLTQRPVNELEELRLSAG